MLEPGQSIGQRAHVAAALDVVLATERVDAAPVPADVAGEQHQVDQGEDVVDRVVVLGDARASSRSSPAARSPARAPGPGSRRPGRRSPAPRTRACTTRPWPCRPRSRTVARSMNSRFSRPDAMISRATALASAMSLPTSRPSQLSAHSALDVRRGSTAISRAPLCTALRTWWKKIGCVSRALLPQRTIRSVSSTSRYELVPPPAPNTVARPATLGACQVRLQLSMLLLPRTCRLNFCAAKLTSLVALLQLKVPKVVGP